MKLFFAVLFFCSLCVHAAFAQDTKPLPPIKPVEKVDLNRYIGKWYEIALLPNRFQARCLSDTAAEYALQPDGKIQVTNRCRNADGKLEMVIGAAKNASGDTSNAKLKVRFASAWLSFIPLVWGDYWVIELDPEYRYAVVSEPKREFLWILSRTPKMDDAVYAGIVERLKSNGFDTVRLKLTPQSVDLNPMK
jgi:apolipoprotein D and lipocalin family protein